MPYYRVGKFRFLTILCLARAPGGLAPVGGFAGRA